MRQKTKGAIAAGHPKTVEAGIETFNQGGNAFDAAVAAILASFVTESTLTSAGGGGFLLAHTQDKQDILFDFFTQTPLQKQALDRISFYPVDVDFGDAVQEFHIGLGSMAVPGNLAGVFRVHQQLGELPFKVVAEPAIHFAKSGIEVSDFQAYLLNLLKPILTASPEGLKTYGVRGQLPQRGNLLSWPDFADTLTALIENGSQAFYQGEIAQKLVRDCQELGGHLTLDDLKNYQVIERKPLKINYRGYQLLTNPPPSSGGTLIAFALKLLSTVELEKLTFGSKAHLNLLAEVMHLTNTARNDAYNHRVYQENIAELFLAEESLLTYQKMLSKIPNKLGSTTHISVMDERGNAASVTTSNGEGSGYIIPGTGIMVNNMLGEEDLSPHGFHQWQENVRISSMMAPTIILEEGSPKIVLGTGGSNRIRTAILQVISNLIDFKMPVKLAVESPRVHWENNSFNLEPGFIEASDRPQFSHSDRLIVWQQKNMFFGGVHTIVKNEGGELEGAGDLRRSGAIAKT